MEKLNIPKTIHVGYRRRDDTYSGMLGFVIYTDEKGNKRKLVGCDGWRDHSIEMTDHVNEPTSGFVLNKGVGGARQSWGHNVRNEYIRVFDPRGFEFEISVANLLFILQECTSTKGKGLEGEFVYSWDGKELVLLPVGCHEYNQSAVFTAAKSLKVTKNDMQEGCVYMHKNMHQMVYLGKHNIRDDNGARDWTNEFRKSLYEPPKKTVHAFYDLETNKYKFERGFTNIAQRDTDTPYPTFADLYSDLVNGPHVSCIDRVVLVQVTPTQQNKNKWLHQNILVQVEVDKYHLKEVKQYEGSWSLYSTIDLHVSLHDLQNPTFDYVDGNNRLRDCCFDGLLDPKYQQKLFTIQYVLKSGQIIRAYGYVHE